MKKILFSPFKIGNLLLPNRIIRAAMYEPVCRRGIITEEFIQMHEKSIDGGVGLTTTGFVAVSEEGRISDNQLIVPKNSMENLTELTQRIHDKNGKISLQIAFCGSGAFWGEPFKLMEFTEKELNKVVDDYALTASIAKEANFDAIELHHFYNTQFLYPEYNTRIDKYGGDNLENRMKFPMTVVKKVKEIIGDDLALFLKYDMILNENMDDLIEIAQNFEKNGVDGLVSFKMRGIDDPHDLYVLEEAKTIQENINIPIIYSCGIDNLEDCETVLEYNFELMQIGRSILRDIELPNKIKDNEKIIECIKCNGCHKWIWEDLPKLECAIRK